MTPAALRFWLISVAAELSVTTGQDVTVEWVAEQGAALVARWICEEREMRS